MPLSPTSELLNTATHGQRKKYFIAGKILQISLKLDHGCGVQRPECTAAHQKVRLQLAGDVLQLGGDWFWLIVFELRNDTMADDLLWQMNMTPKYVFNGLMLKSSLERGGTEGNKSLSQGAAGWTFTGLYSRRRCSCPKSQQGFAFNLCNLNKLTYVNDVTDVTYI